MTVALGVVAGVAVVAFVAALLAWQGSSRRLAGAGSRLAEVEGQLAESRKAEEAAGRELAEERRRSGEADARAAEAEVRAARAESRASSAEAAIEALIAARSPAVVAEIERVRLEREWREVSGPDASLPVRWDASVGAALEIELEIIREVTGTPGRLEVEGADPGEARPAGLDDNAAEALNGTLDEAVDGAVDEAKLWMLGSLGCELLRVVARYSDEMIVRLHHGPSKTPALAAVGIGARSLPDLVSLELAAKALGVSVAVQQRADCFEVRLSADQLGLSAD